MTVAILATAILSIAGVAAILYALHLRVEVARLRAAKAYYLELINDLIAEDE